MTVEILNTSNNTWVDITKWIAWQGLTFSRNDIDSPDAGRTMDGLMHRGRVAIKEKMNVNTVPMSQSEVATLSALINPESFSVRITPYPKTNSQTILSVYANNVNINSLIHRSNGTDLYTMTFPMVEN